MALRDGISAPQRQWPLIESGGRLNEGCFGGGAEQADWPEQADWADWAQ